MNKEKIAEELNAWTASKVGSGFETDICNNDLTLFYDNECIAWFTNFEADKFGFVSSSDYQVSIELTRKDVIKKFYEKGIELLSKYETKYTVQVIADNPVSYLNVDKFNGKIVFGDKGNSECYRKNFTQQEIDELKKRDDVAVDWDKAIIKEV